jgi:hypothetical protein
VPRQAQHPQAACQVSADRESPRNDRALGVPAIVMGMLARVAKSPLSGSSASSPTAGGFNLEIRLERHRWWYATCDQSSLSRISRRD